MVRQLHAHGRVPRPVLPYGMREPGQEIDASQSRALAFKQQETSYASAISLVFFVLVLLISAVQRYLTREKD